MYVLFEIVFLVFDYYCFEGHREDHRHSNSGPPFSSFGPSCDYGMDLCLEVYLNHLSDVYFLCLFFESFAKITVFLLKLIFFFILI